MNKNDLKIVVVDDEIILLDIYQSVFESGGYKNILCFSDSVKAFEYITQNHINVLITDFQMPGKNGLKLIKAADKVKNKFIISGSFIGNGSLRQECANLGAVPIDKPFKPQLLIELMDEVFLQYSEYTCQ
uniref:Signal transduction response regulator n=1 Tax=uncultured microorganism TaxID=358574 RepID=F8UGW9_9ZZZZ|nr:signal transduction response regulator [uncultured microorganism]